MMTEHSYLFAPIPSARQPPPPTEAEEAEVGKCWPVTLLGAAPRLQRPEATRPPPLATPHFTQAHHGAKKDLLLGAAPPPSRELISGALKQR